MVQVISSKHTCFVSIGNCVSEQMATTCGVPKGSILRPLLVDCYMLPLCQIIQNNKVSYHNHADDTQIYISLTLGASTCALFKIVHLLPLLYFLYLVKHTKMSWSMKCPYKVVLPCFGRKTLSCKNISNQAGYYCLLLLIILLSLLMKVLRPLHPQTNSSHSTLKSSFSGLYADIEMTIMFWSDM